MATYGKSQEVGFPPISWEEEILATRPMPLHELPVQVGIDMAMAVVGGVNELALQLIEQERVQDLKLVTATAGALLRAVVVGAAGGQTGVPNPV